MSAGRLARCRTSVQIRARKKVKLNYANGLAKEKEKTDGKNGEKEQKERKQEGAHADAKNKAETCKKKHTVQSA